MFTQKTIDLHLPESWNACTVEELEIIAHIIAACAIQSDSYHPFNMLDVKTQAFFALAGVEIVEHGNPDAPVDERYFVCRIAGNKKEVFNLYVWQVHSWIESELKWLDGNSLTRFPYPVLRRGSQHKEFHGPAALMQDFSWQRYRFAQDYMQLCIDRQNALVRMQDNPQANNKTGMKKALKGVMQARAFFLAILYTEEITVIDGKTQEKRRSFTYHSNQVSDNAKYFMRFSDLQWQVILFWWQGMMYYLQRRYPRCFRKQKITKGFRPANPLELYVRTTATMEKYLGLDEEKVNSQNFQIVLQHIEDMAKENEELEKIKKK